MNQGKKLNKNSLKKSRVNKPLTPTAVIPTVKKATRSVKPPPLTPNAKKASRSNNLPTAKKASRSVKPPPLPRELNARSIVPLLPENKFKPTEKKINIKPIINNLMTNPLSSNNFEDLYKLEGINMTRSEFKKYKKL